jgi:hypothetical protein
MNGRVVDFRFKPEGLNNTLVPKNSMAKFYLREHNTAFPANKVIYHPTYENFLISCGENGKIIFSDGAYKTHKEIKMSSPVQSIDIDNTGNYVVIGTNIVEDIRTDNTKANLSIIKLTDQDFPN